MAKHAGSLGSRISFSTCFQGLFSSIRI
jgi:hypothetical protein